MTHEPPGDFTLVRAAGAAIGALLSLVYIPPKSVKEAVSRALFSVPSGFIFGFIILDYMKWPQTFQHWMAATVVVGMFSWLLAGVVVRILDSVNKWPPWKS